MYYLLYAIITALAIFINIKFIYFLFLVVLLRNKKKCVENTETLFLTIAIASVILPDNYSAEVCFLLYFCVTFLSAHSRKIKRNSNTILAGVALFLTIFSALINKVPMTNICFAIISFAPLISFLLLKKNIKTLYYYKIKFIINDVFIIELLATIFNFIAFFKSKGDDWSCGTFSRKGGAQAQLFIIAAFLLLFYIDSYKNKSGKREDLCKAIGAMIICISTNCWTLTLFLMVGVGMAYISNLTYKRMLAILIGICCIPLFGFILINYAPGSIATPLHRIITDSSYFEYRFHKAVVYKETFLVIPLQDLCFALIGNGIGNYNSRAALICTGYYVKFFNKLFSPSVSEYTEKYILDYVRYAALEGGSDYGSVLARPYSSILAIMGEYGYIGIFIFLVIVQKNLKTKKFETKLLIFVWLSFCLVENYFEYPKIIVLLYACLIGVYSEKTSQKNKLEVHVNDK